jgi:hypothetical protein
MDAEYSLLNCLDHYDYWGWLDARRDQKSDVRAAVNCPVQKNRLKLGS